MSDPERTRETRRWISFAQDDLRAAETLLGSEELPPRLACFHAQQAAEKALKALLVAQNAEFPRTHDLLVLSRLLPEDFDTNATDKELVELGKWAVESRYPGDLPEATEEDARAAVEQAGRVYETALNDLEEHGYDQKSEEPRGDPAEEETS